jgi:hypothetical protein
MLANTFNKCIRHPKCANVKLITRRVVRVKSNFISDINNFGYSMHYVAENISVFTIIFCGLNYLYYKSIREKIDKK